jgi:glutamate dehydrogenase/leucine dehydrogenase
LHDHPHGRKLDTDAILDIACDIWIPAARPDVIRKDNVDRLKTRMVPQGANIPCTIEAERILHDRGVLVVPDFIANAGGVICASVEYRGGTRQGAFDHIDERIRTNTARVLEQSGRTGESRAAAMALAEARVKPPPQPDGGADEKPARLRPLKAPFVCGRLPAGRSS